MTKVINEPSRMYSTGKMNTTAISVDESWKNISLIFTRESWPDTGQDVVAAQIDLSLDGGTTWIAPYFGFTAAGGVALDREGNSSTESKINAPLPDQVGIQQRLIRVSFDVKTPITTTVSVEVT
jgi:hypothetical protein